MFHQMRHQMSFSMSHVHAFTEKAVQKVTDQPVEEFNNTAMSQHFLGHLMLMNVSLFAMHCNAGISVIKCSFVRLNARLASQPHARSSYQLDACMYQLYRHISQMVITYLEVSKTAYLCYFSSATTCKVFEPTSSKNFIMVAGCQTLWVSNYLKWHWHGKQYQTFYLQCHKHVINRSASTGETVKPNSSTCT